MIRLKRTQFWGEDDDDDRLILQVLAGEKTATAGPTVDYDTPYGPYDDGGYEAGDLVEVCDLKKRLRCIINITECYHTSIGQIPEKLWRGEGNRSAAEFKENHRY
ncbi:MAG: ASCH domain-containing protein [Desulfobulbaceae bacterium]|nr:MAG: ASCH domain-containing protein [Desulfobulbaceae bacterium]